MYMQCRSERFFPKKRKFPKTPLTGLSNIGKVSSLHLNTLLKFEIILSSIYLTLNCSYFVTLLKYDRLWTFFNGLIMMLGEKEYKTVFLLPIVPEQLPRN